MPTGQKSIAWTQENVSKLFSSILIVHDIEIDYDAVAKEFGSGLNGAAVARYVYKFRAKSKKNGQALGSAPVGSLSAARGRKTGGGKKANKVMNNESDEDLDHEKDESDGASTPPQTPIKTEDATDKVLHGRVTKRISPRKNEKKDYKKMVDPYVGMNDLEDENGEQMFENKGFSSEDSDPTDTEFGSEHRSKSTHEPVKKGEAI